MHISRGATARRCAGVLFGRGHDHGRPSFGLLRDLPADHTAARRSEPDAQDGDRVAALSHLLVPIRAPARRLRLAGHRRLPDIDVGLRLRSPAGDLGLALLGDGDAAPARCHFSAARCSALRMPVHTLAQRRAWSEFLRALVGRYGPTGSFWELHPELPRDPIRTWQIWNEENDHRFAEASVSDYATLLRGAAPAIRSVDPDARILLGGLYATPRIEPALDATTFLSRLYDQRGIKDLFDGVRTPPLRGQPEADGRRHQRRSRRDQESPRRPQRPLHHRVRLGLPDSGGRR